jgi:hypothetical protein
LLRAVLSLSSDTARPGDGVGDGSWHNNQAGGVDGRYRCCQHDGSGSVVAASLSMVAGAGDNRLARCRSVAGCTQDILHPCMVVGRAPGGAGAPSMVHTASNMWMGASASCILGTKDWGRDCEVLQRLHL